MSETFSQFPARLKLNILKHLREICKKLRKFNFLKLLFTKVPNHWNHNMKLQFYNFFNYGANSAIYFVTFWIVKTTSAWNHNASPVYQHPPLQTGAFFCRGRDQQCLLESTFLAGRNVLHSKMWRAEKYDSFPRTVKLFLTGGLDLEIISPLWKKSCKLLKVDQQRVKLCTGKAWFSFMNYGPLQFSSIMKLSRSISTQVEVQTQIFVESDFPDRNNLWSDFQDTEALWPDFSDRRRSDQTIFRPWSRLKFGPFPRP